MIDINQSFFSIIMDTPESLSTDPQVLQQLDKLAFIRMFVTDKMDEITESVTEVLNNYKK